MRAFIICILVAFSLPVWGQADRPLGKRVIKFNLVTPLSFTPTFELSYEHFLTSKTSLQLNTGFIAGSMSGLYLDPVYDQPSPSPLGYRVAFGPRFFVIPNENGTGGGYFGPTLMFKQLLDNYPAQFGMHDEMGWWGFSYFQEGTVRYRKSVIDLSFQLGYESGKRFVVDVYGGPGIRYKVVQEKEELVLAYEGQKYTRVDPYYYTEIDQIEASDERRFTSLIYSFPVGVRLGYRF